MDVMADFLAFGSQYYRAPTPFERHWERDLADIAAAGFNTVKIWAQWRTNCTAPDAYDFADVERLLDLCEKNRLRAIVNTVLDGAPTWFGERYPDHLMVTADGRVMTPRTIPHRQVGGAPGPCFRHPQGRQARADFLRALASRIGGHPALLLWDLWNEPELSVGLLRPPVVSDLLCYCAHCRRAFIEWLRAKYGDIAALNTAWHGYFGSFEHIEMPRDNGLFKPMVDLRKFVADVMADELKLRVDAVKACDARHPVMVHTVPLPHFNIITTGSDDYKLAKLCDLYGCSIGSEPFAAAVTASAAPGKRVMNSEIHAMGGSTYARPAPPTLRAFKRHIFTPLARGMRGFQFWQYRAEVLGREAPAWGLVDLAGRPGPQLGYAKQINDAMQTHARAILGSSPPAAQVAILNSGMNQIFDWCASGSIDIHYRSLRGAFDALHAHNFMVDILSEEQMIEQSLDAYKLVVAPFSHYMCAALADKLRRYVRAGGHLLGDAFFGAVSDEDGCFCERQPGLGFDEVFGCEEHSAASVYAFLDAYHGDALSGALERARVPLRVAGGGALTGYHFLQRFALRGGEALAHFEDGGVAAVRHRCGAGTATVVGSLIFYRAGEDNARWIARRALDAGACPTAQSPEGVRVDVLRQGDAARCVFIANDTREDAACEIVVPGLAAGALVNVLTGERVAVSPGGAICARVERGEIELFVAAD